MLQKIVIYHCLSYAIFFQVIKKKLTMLVSIMVAKCDKMLFFYLKNCC